MECKNCGMYNQTSIVACQKCGGRLVGSANNIVYKPNTDVAYNLNTHSFEEFDSTINSLLREDVVLSSQLNNNTQSNEAPNPNINQPSIDKTTNVATPVVKGKRPKQSKQSIELKQQPQVQSVGVDLSQAVPNHEQRCVASQPNRVMDMSQVQQPVQQPVQQVIYTTAHPTHPQYINYAQQPVYDGQYVQPQYIVPQYIVSPYVTPQPVQKVSSDYKPTRYNDRSGSAKSVSLIAFFAGVVGWLALFVALVFGLDIKQSGLVSFVLGVAGIVCVFLAYGLGQNKIWATVALVIIIQLIIYSSIVMLV